jgi:hypothetical protein
MRLQFWRARSAPESVWLLKQPAAAWNRTPTPAGDLGATLRG